ncbi:MAG: PA14 domain-containing protein [Rariglobus sp.]
MSDSPNKFVRYLKRFGAGSMLVSIIIHVIILGSATVWVVSSSMPARKPNFQGGGNNSSAPAVQHAVKMANTQPNLAALTQRLVVENASSSVTLPDLPATGNTGPGGPSTGGLSGGPGQGQGQGIGNLKAPIMPLFGFKEPPSTATLVGRFYDLKQNRSKKPNPNLVKLGPAALAIKEVTEFIKGGWTSGSLSEFFQAPTTLYATQIFVPVMSADEAPKAYGVEKEVQPRAWIAHYRGRVSPPATGAYRFVGAGDDLMAVRIDGRLVLDCGGTKGSTFKTDRTGAAKPSYNYNFQKNNWLMSTRGCFTVGNRMELKAGLFYDIDIVFSEGPGGQFCAMLLFEEEGVGYKKDANGNPILPIFRIAANPTTPASTGPQFDPDGPIWRAVNRP